MPRPNGITEEDIKRWDEKISNDPYVSKNVLKSELMKELCYAGCWLTEALIRLSCPDDLVQRILFSAGRYSFGRDIWAAHEEVLLAYQNDDLEYESDEDLN